MIATIAFVFLLIFVIREVNANGFEFAAMFRGFSFYVFGPPLATAFFVYVSYRCFEWILNVVLHYRFKQAS